MSRYRQLKQQYEELNDKYARLYEANLELAYQYQQMQEELEEKEQQREEVYALHQSSRKLKHDMKNHLMVICSYLASENYDEAKAYSSGILDKLNAMHSYIETGNTLLNHIINEKFQYAREQGIGIKAEIENVSFAAMSSIDFAALLSNMLDNAIEASFREEENHRELELLITKKQGYETICVKNKISTSVLEGNPDLLSTKEEGDAHGIGILRYQWQLAKLSPNEYYKYITTGDYPLRGVIKEPERKEWSTGLGKEEDKDGKAQGKAGEEI